MITIKGTGKIKGALDLSGINKQLKAGDALPITEEEFNDHTVQVALSMGFLKFERGGLIDMPTDTSVNVKNIYDRPLRINILDADIRPGQTFTLTEGQINSSDIRGALAKGYLEIMSSARPSDDAKESDIRVGNLFSKDKEEEPMGSGLDLEPDYLETNEEVENPSIINTENPDPVTAEDIPDPKRASIIWNPNNDPITHTSKGMKAVAISKSGEVDPLETNVEIPEISFVDAEMDKERRESHPVLKNKPTGVNDGIDFL